MAIKGGIVGSIKAARSATKKGGTGYSTRVPADGITVRFLSEPDTWAKYQEHYDPDMKYFPCQEDESMCPGVHVKGADGAPQKRFLVNAVDRTENKVIPLVLPASVAAMLMKKYDKWGTIMDRDYEIDKEGTGKDTTYDITPGEVKPFRVGRYELLDLIGLLNAQIPSDEEEDLDDEDEEDDDEDDAPVRRVARKGVAKKTVAKRVVRKPISTTKGGVTVRTISKPLPAKRVVKKAVPRRVVRRG